MIRRLAALLVAGLLVSACGTVSVASALRTWVSQSSFHSAVASLRSDAVHAATVLRDAKAPTKELHTVCGVLDFETLQANAALPTPDDQATNLLAKAYNNFGAGANECYHAASSVRLRAKSIAWLEEAASALSEATARIDAASAKS